MQYNYFRHGSTTKASITSIPQKTLITTGWNMKPREGQMKLLHVFFIGFFKCRSKGLNLLD